MEIEIKFDLEQLKIIIQENIFKGVYILTYDYYYILDNLHEEFYIEHTANELPREYKIFTEKWYILNILNKNKEKIIEELYSKCKKYNSYPFFFYKKIIRSFITEYFNKYETKLFRKLVTK